QLISKHQSHSSSEILNAKANARQLVDALRVIITGDQFRALPDPTQLMQPAAHGRRRNRDATLYLHLRSQRCTTPARPTPAISRRCALEQGQQRATQRRRQRANAMRRLRIGQAGKRAGAISVDGAINAGARTEQDRRNLRWRIALCAQQEDVQSQPIAVASVSEFKEQLFLLGAREVNYCRTGHRAYSLIDRVFGNKRNIKEQQSVPTSC